MTDPIPGCEAAPKDESDLFEWSSTIQGPENSPYMGGTFLLDIHFPDDYPFKAPKVRLSRKEGWKDDWERRLIPADPLLALAKTRSVSLIRHLFIDQLCSLLYQVKFRTRIYHCNINRKGEICVDILKNNWSAAITLTQLLLSICALLVECNPEDPLEAEIAQQFIRDRSGHDKVAKEWTRKFALRDL